MSHPGEWAGVAGLGEQEGAWMEEPEVTAVISTVVCRLRAWRLDAEAAEVAALLYPVSVALDKSA